MTTRKGMLQICKIVRFRTAIVHFHGDFTWEIRDLGGKAKGLSAFGHRHGCRPFYL